LAWLVFANFLLFAGGGIAIAVVVGSHTKPQEPEVSRFVEPSRAASTQLVDLESVHRPPIETTIRTTPPSEPAPSVPSKSAPAPKPPSKPTPAPEPPRQPPADPPKPPPLPKSQQKEKTNPAEEKKPQGDKPHPPAAEQRGEQPVHWLPTPMQKRVDRSIDNGVEFLRRKQRADGGWGNQTGVSARRFTPGITALCGLTLLECGVPAKDAQVRSAAHYLRQRMPDLTNTYSVSLAILFFDRLGEEADAARIRTLALRLIAAQKPSGGWDYFCPTLSDDEELGLLALLYKDRPTTLNDLFATERGKDPSLEREAKLKEGKLDSELYRPQPSKMPPLELFIEQPREGSPFSRDPKGSAENKERKNESGERKAESGERLPGDSRRLTQRALEAAEKLPEELRRIPALRAAELLHDRPELNEPRTDNSNTQFAVLGLLTAENYDVPMERAMALLDWRFRNSMTVQGGWEYRPGDPRLICPATPVSMTAAALMGLALKHGLLLPNRKGRGRDVVVHDDEIIHRGFITLTGMLNSYYASFAFNPAQLDQLDLYCLWTIERVAVLYNQKTLGDLDWYPAGVQLLLPLQRGDGSWSPEGTHCLKESSVSSSFALLFLKRSNLARGLSERLKAPNGE
jgi:hypothetical protein